MKKYGKKWRKLEAEKKIIRARMQAKAGEPFSRARRCVHYAGLLLPGIHRRYYSLLEPISEKECMCSVCKKRFPIEKYAQMSELARYLSDSECVRDEEYFNRYSKLSQGLEPVYYRRLSETETEILGTKKPNKTGET